MITVWTVPRAEVFSSYDRLATFLKYEKDQG